MRKTLVAFAVLGVFLLGALSGLWGTKSLVVDQLLADQGRPIQMRHLPKGSYFVDLPVDFERGEAIVHRTHPPAPNLVYYTTDLPDPKKGVIFTVDE